MMKDQNNLIRHSIIVLALTHTANIANLLFHVVMGRTLPKEEYAILVSALGIALIFATPMVAIQNTLAHFTGRLQQQNRSGDIRSMVRSWIGKIMMIGTPLVLLMLACCNRGAAALHLPSSVPLIIIACAIFAALFVPVLSGALQGVQSFVWMCVTANAWGIVRLVLGAVLVVYVSASAISGVTAHAVGMVISLLAGAAGIALVIPKGTSSGQQLDQSDRYFFLSLAAMLGFSVLMYADMILVKGFFTNAEDYGNYARASTIARTLVFLPLPIAGVLFPKVVSEGDKSPADTGTLIKALLFTCVIIAGSLMLFIVFPKILLLALYKESSPTADMIRLVRLLSCAMAPLGLTFMMMNFELAQRRFTCLWILAACAMALVGGICFFHVSLWNVVITLACAASVSAIVLAVLSFRR